jgi:hypothetical protein
MENQLKVQERCALAKERKIEVLQEISNSLKNLTSFPAMDL